MDSPSPAPTEHATQQHRTKPLILVVGSSGEVERLLVERLADRYDSVTLGRARGPCPHAAGAIPADLASDESVHDALAQLRERFGSRIAAVLQLAEGCSVGDAAGSVDAADGTGPSRLLRALQGFEVGQFVFASTVLVHAPSRPGLSINEDSALQAKSACTRSLLRAEQQVRREHGRIPYVILRLAEVYTAERAPPTLARAIAHVHGQAPAAASMPDGVAHGPPSLHVDDLLDLFAAVVDRRDRLPAELVLLAGEGSLSREQLESELARLIHGEACAESAAGAESKKPFDHYQLDIGRAQTLLGWIPQRRLLDTLPSIVASLKRDPEAWHEANGLATKPGDSADDSADAEHGHDNKRHEGHGQKSDHDMLLDMHHGMLWPHYVNAALGCWLLLSPFALGYLSAFEPTANVLRTFAERGLSSPEAHNRWMAWSDGASGLLIVLFSLLSADPKRRFSWSQWANAAVGSWLLFAPLVFWTPLPAAYANDTLVGMLVIAFAVLVPMMPGMSMAGMMGGPDIPPGWNYTPSSFAQRFPIAALGLFGLLLSRYLAAYQLGHIDRAWDPFFDEGTMTIITSDMSKAWPIADAGVGTVAYAMEVLMAVMGTKTRWRTMPWMVLAFIVLVVPLGGVSIFFIIVQPIVIGTWCSLCLLMALAMLIMIPYALDELVASGQFLLDAYRRGKPFWRTLWMGDAMEGGSQDKTKGFAGEPRQLAREMLQGVNWPWALLASCAIGTALMFTRLLFDTSGAMANSDHLVGSLVLTVTVMAAAEVARALRFVNIGFGLWLVAAPWWLDGVATPVAAWASVAAGIALIALAFPKGPVRNRYGGWDRYIV